MSQVEIGYWKYRGFGHPVRFILQYLEVPYKEQRFELPEGENASGDKWLAVREKVRKSYPSALAFPNLPYVLDGDKAVSESSAVMKYIARKYGPHLLGEDETRVDMFNSFLYDFWYNDFGQAVYKHDKEAIDNFEAQHPIKLPLLSKWSTGDKITYVDFLFCEFLHHLTVYKPNILDAYPNLKRLRDDFKQLPAIKKYMNSSDFFHEPCYSSRANYKM